MNLPDKPPEDLNTSQLDTLQALVAEPSHYYRKKSPLDTQPDNDEIGVLKIIEGELTNCGCKITRQNLEPPDTRYNLIVEKGEGDFVVLIYGHVDTINHCDTNSPKASLKMEKIGDNLYGAGVYDMKAGLMVMIDVMRSFDPPPGVKVILVFSPDEELTSNGAMALRSYPGIAKVNLVMSPEIATLLHRQEKDHKKDVIIARRGNLKSRLHVTTPAAHGFRDDMPNSLEILTRTGIFLEQEFAKNPFENQDIFGKMGVESLRLMDWGNDPDSSHSQPDDSWVDFRHQILPPNNTVEKAMEWQKKTIAQWAARQNWAGNGVEWKLTETPGRRSYDPYSCDMSTPIAAAFLQNVDAIYGGHNLRGGGSTADGCILVPWLRQLGNNAPWFDIGPVGNNPHAGSETVSAASIAILSHFYKHVILRGIPDFLAHGTKKS